MLHILSYSLFGKELHMLDILSSSLFGMELHMLGIPSSSLFGKDFHVTHFLSFRGSFVSLWCHILSSLQLRRGHHIWHLRWCFLLSAHLVWHHFLQILKKCLEFWLLTAIMKMILWWPVNCFGSKRLSLMKISDEYAHLLFKWLYRTVLTMHETLQ